MADRKRQRSQATVSNGDSFHESPSCFFKRIPQMFVKKFANELRDVAKLTVPNGRVWPVELKKDGREIWFHNGWHDFVTFHLISAGFFLVFKYAKDSSFDVLIFDMTACEIDYPCCNGEPKHGMQKNLVPGDDMEKEEDSIEIIRSATPDKNGKHNSHRSLRHLKRHRTKTTEIQSGILDDDDIVGNDKDLEEPSNKRPKSVADGDYVMAELKRMGIDVCNSKYTRESQRAIAAAKFFRPRNPSFMIILMSVNRVRGFLHIPVKFANKYLTKASKFVKVRVSNGREWNVRTIYKKGGILSFGKGWCTIWDAMDLTLDDICLFELIRENEPLLKLSVFNASMEVD